MPLRHRPGLSLAEWMVLWLVSEEPAHCFALAALLAPDGSVGMVWHVQKTEVYRAAQRLERLGPITAAGKQTTSGGPPRGPPSLPPQGQSAVHGRLRPPAREAPDPRTEL